MDDSAKRAGGIPRLSRLPQPRPASGIPKPSSTIPRPTSIARPPATKDSGGLSRQNETVGASTLIGDSSSPRLRASASRDQLRTSATTGTPRTPRLRTSASRDQLRATAPPRASATKASHPPVSTANHTRVPSTPQRRTSPSSETTTQESTTPTEPTDVDEFLFKRRLTLTRRPSEVFAASPLQESSEEISDQATQFANIEVADSNVTVRPASSKGSRPSLSERTIDSLSSIPSTPALRKKTSSFFDQGRPKSRDTSRPGSSYNSDGSIQPTARQSLSRPASRGGQDGGLAGSFGSLGHSKKPSIPAVNGTPRTRAAASQSGAKTPVLRKSTSRLSLASSSRLPSSATAESAEARSPSPDKKTYDSLATKSTSKSVTTRTLKPRASVNGLFKKPSLPAINSTAANASQGQNPTSSSAQSSSAGSWDGTIPSNASITSTSTALTVDSGELAGAASARKSSAALRDQIAQAKAAKRAAMKRDTPLNSTADTEAPIIPSDDGFDFGMGHDDPFNLNRGQGSSKKVLSQRISAARTSGRLNIAALGLKEIPQELLKMYDLSSMGTNDGSWAESVDLTRVVAADNELETLDESVFPDIDPEAYSYDDDTQGNIFGGLETLDLHGNLLLGVPVGFRRLAHMTSLNLSSNRLTNDSIEVLAQIPSLRDLKLAKNLFFGPLHSDLSNLTSLEILDLRGNNVSALPRKMEKMARLRILDLSENSLESLPFDELSQLPLTELSLRKNKLSGTLIEEPVESFPQLHTLDVSSNQLTRLVPLGSSISFPLLHVLSLSNNRLQGLPDMTSWSSLLTLNVEENSISSIPNSFTTLEKLRHADFSSNDIRVVPPEISRMTNLTMIRLNGNPLRDKKFVSITTEDLKEILAGRLEPPPPYQESGKASGETPIEEIIGGPKMTTTDPQAASATASVLSKRDESLDDSRSDYDDDFATPPTSAPHSPARSRSHTNTSLRSRSQTLSNHVWPVKQGGLLDRSRTESSSLHPVVCSKLAAEHTVRQVWLNNNLFGAVPNSLSFFADTMTCLSLTQNQLVGETYLTEEMDFPALKELNLSSNRITSLVPLTKFLHAPALEKLDVSLNRLNSLPPNLKEVFPSLSVLLISDNQIADLTPEAIKGLKIVDARSNDIAHLNPRIGLLGGPGGLERLDVMGNRFRVPRWNVLERGTEATLRWLRGRVPIAEMGQWQGDDDADGAGGVD